MSDVPPIYRQLFIVEHRELFSSDAVVSVAFHDASIARDNFIITNVNRDGNIIKGGFYTTRYSTCMPNFYYDTSDIKFIRYTPDKLYIGELL